MSNQSTGLEGADEAAVFLRYLEEVRMIVSSWPSWKQEILGWNIQGFGQNVEMQETSSSERVVHNARPIVVLRNDNDGR